MKPKVVYYSHFGKAADALEKLQTHANQLKLWAKIVTEKMKTNATIEEIKEEITKRDPTIGKVEEYIKTHPILNRGVISQDIQGFVEYFRNIEKPR